MEKRLLVRVVDIQMPEIDFWHKSIDWTEEASVQIPSEQQLKLAERDYLMRLNFADHGETLSVYARQRGRVVQQVAQDHDINYDAFKMYIDNRIAEAFGHEPGEEVSWLTG